MNAEYIANIMIITAGIIWGIELIPQMIKTHKLKSANDISLAFFVMCFIAYSLYAGGNFLLKNWIILYAHIPSLLFNLIMMILILKYRKKKCKKKKK